MDKNIELEDLVMFTTGALIRPQKLINEDGGERWVWIVSEFIDDTFFDGDVHNPQEAGETLRKLLSQS
jgi:hypothetical protein